MKTTAIVARFLLALAFIVFGLNGFFHFMPQPPPPSEQAKQFFAATVPSHFMVIVFVVQLVAGILFIFARTVPLALTLIAPVIVNILNYHACMDAPGIIPGVIVTILWLIVFWQYRWAFYGILNGRRPNETTP